MSAPTDLRAAAYAALGAGRVVAWAAEQGITPHRARALAGAHRLATGAPRHKPRPGDLTNEQLQRPLRELAELCGVSGSDISIERRRRSLAGWSPRTPDAGPSPGLARLATATREELERCTVADLAARYRVRKEAVTARRRELGIGRVVETPLPPPPTLGALPEHRESERAELAAPAERLRVGPRFAVDPRAYDSEIRPFDPHREPDPRWVARFERERRVRGEFA